MDAAGGAPMMTDEAAADGQAPVDLHLNALENT